ncbi:MAG TPA: hypothetical protein VH933_16000 [Aestuariivirgaceae bacterium]|jgi:hypothetical protein
MATSPQTVVDVSVEGTRGYIDWPAVLAGVVLASAISFVLFTFGTGIGLSITSPYPERSVSPTGFVLALGLWVLWVSISSFIAGGYLAGRMRRRLGTASEHEIEVRDAVHGLLVWAVGVLVGALIAAWVTGLAASKTADVAAGAATGATAAAAQVADEANPNAYWTDVLLRPGAPAAATTTAAPVATSEARLEAQRIMSSRITEGKLPDEDRAYLTRRVMDATGLSEADAAARVDAAVTGLSQAKAQAQRLAERARKFSVLLTFITAASLAIAAAASWWAAVIGGRHRDQAKDFSHLFGRSPSIRS